MRARKRGLPSVRWLLGGERLTELGQFVACFAVYLVLDRLIRAAARMSADTVKHSVLVTGAIAESPSAWLVVAAALVVGATWQRSRLWAAWDVFDRGPVVRGVAAVPLALVTWLSSTYHYNYLAGQWHAIDRLLVIVLAVASFQRPVFLIPFALEARVISAQFVVPFGTVAGPNIDALLITLLIGFAALHVGYVLTGSPRSASIVMLLSTVLASHFFVPGSGETALGWFGVNRLWNFPLSAYTAGWLGHTSGDWARQMARLVEPLNLPLQVVTLLVELGSGIAVAHPKLLRWWLVLALAFHTFVFAMAGFWFVGWMAIEVTLLGVLWAPSLQAWVNQHATPARGLVAAGIVMVAGARLYQPPTLSWFDGPASYGYELEGVGISGASYHVPLAVAAPFEQELTFLRLRLAPTREAANAYGAVGTRAEFEALNALTSLEKLLAYERRLPPPASSDVEAAQQFVARLLEHINGRGQAPWFLWPLPTHFWTSRPPPLFAYQESLARLEIVRVTALHRSDGQVVRRESLATVHAAPDGSVRVTESL